jgi:uncharacterized membrane protein YobD (UPF0266 family)
VQRLGVIGIFVILIYSLYQKKYVDLRPGQQVNWDVALAQQGQVVSLFHFSFIFIVSLFFLIVFCFQNSKFLKNLNIYPNVNNF